MATDRATAIVRGPDDGERYWFYGGGVHLWKITGADTDGALFLFEDQLEKGKMTPYHRHPTALECTYILEGEILFNADGVERTVGEGGFTMTPAGIPHAFMVTSDTARLLDFQTPGSGASFYIGASEPATPELVAAAPVDFDRVLASGAANGGFELVGPPPFPR